MYNSETAAVYKFLEFTTQTAKQTARTTHRQLLSILAVYKIFNARM
jgi:hypothetical protein